MERTVLICRIMNGRKLYTMPISTAVSVYSSSAFLIPNKDRNQEARPPLDRIPIHAYVRTSMLIHIGTVIAMMRMPCVFRCSAK